MNQLKFKGMKSTNSLFFLILSALLFVCVVHSSAQSTKIAIVSMEDTLLVNQHVGFTIFANFTDTLHLDLPIAMHVEQQLQKYLAPTYDISFIELPDSIIGNKKEIYGLWGMNKKIKKWISDSKDKYDYVIFTYNTSIPREMNVIVPDKTSGLYSGPIYSSYFTSISFLAFKTENMSDLKYYELGGKFMTQNKEFKLPKDKKSFTPEMLELIKVGFMKHLDSRIEHFLTKTFLVPQNRIDEINAALSSSTK